MNNIQNLIKLDKNSSKKIEAFINEVEKEFIPSLSSKVNITQWSQKLNKYAFNIAKMDNEKIVALISFYANKKTQSYIAFIAVSTSQRGKKLSDSLLTYCIEYCKKINSTNIKVETWISNKKIIKIYNNHGFLNSEIINDRKNNKTLVLEKKLLYKGLK